MASCEQPLIKTIDYSHRFLDWLFQDTLQAEEKLSKSIKQQGMSETLAFYTQQLPEKKLAELRKGKSEHASIVVKTATMKLISSVRF